MAEKKKLESKQISGEMRKQILWAFRQFDRNCDGMISLSEAHSILEYKLGFSREKTRLLLDACDTDKNGQLDADEFANFYVKLQDSNRFMEEVFIELDKDHSGTISLSEARGGLRNMALSEADIDRLMSIYDFNGDGQLNYIEFQKLWNEKC